jgi:hypothetical protein
VGVGRADASSVRGPVQGLSTGQASNSPSSMRCRRQQRNPAASEHAYRRRCKASLASAGAAASCWCLWPGSWRRCGARRPRPTPAAAA